MLQVTNSSRRRIFVTRSLPLPNSLKNHLIHQNKILRHFHPSIRTPSPPPHTTTVLQNDSIQKNENTQQKDTSTSKKNQEDMGTAEPNNDTPTHTNHPETEKERTARLLREAREKSALAKEKKKSKKSKKHDKWIKEQEAEKASRAKGWYVYVCMYVYVVCSELYAFVSAMLQMI